MECLLRNRGFGRVSFFFSGGMASFETPPPSLWQGVRIAPPESNVTVEEVLLAVGEQVGYDNLSFASRMNKAVVVFLKDEQLVHQLIESGVFIRDSFVQVPLYRFPPRESPYLVFLRSYPTRCWGMNFRGLESLRVDLKQ